MARTATNIVNPAVRKKTRSGSTSTFVRPQASRPTTSKRSNAKPRRSKSVKFNFPQIQMKRLTAERKTDIIGWFFLIAGSLTLVGFLAYQDDALFSAWIAFLTRIVGWGVFVLPLVLLIYGFCILFRRSDRFPHLSFNSLCGFALLYLNILTWMHFLSGGDLDLAAIGQGGGMLGVLFMKILTLVFGKAGSIVLLITWFLLSFALTLDRTLIDIFHSIHSWAKKRCQPRPAPIPQDLQRVAPSQPPVLSQKTAAPSPVITKPIVIPPKAFPPLQSAIPASNNGLPQGFFPLPEQLPLEFSHGRSDSLESFPNDLSASMPSLAVQEISPAAGMDSKDTKTVY